jgi:CubicO group peptidase (beta-lactamase class C family)
MKEKIIVYLIFCLCLSALTGCGAKNAGAQRTFPDAEWEKKLPENEGINLVKLQSAMDYLINLYEGYGPGGIIVIRNGFNIWSTNDINKHYNLYSAGKIWFALAVGKMVEEGYCNIDSPVKDWEPLFSTFSEYKEVTLRHLLTFTSGYNAINPGHIDKWENPNDDWSVTPFDPAPPLFAPSSAFLYWDDAVHMLSRVLTAKLGQTVESYVRSKITDPIGLTDFTWDKISDVFPRYNESKINGVDINAIYIYTSASQLARLGYLVLNKGKWNGKQVLKESFMEDITKIQVPVTISLYKNINTDTNFIMADHGILDGRGCLGYMVWVNGINANGNWHMPDAPPATYYATGGWSVLFVIPEWNMIIARTGEHRPKGGVVSAYNETLKRIGESFLDGTPAYNDKPSNKIINN